MSDQPRTRLSRAAKRLRTQRRKEARRVLDEAYQTYINEINNDSNSNKTNANVIANDNTNNNSDNENSIHPLPS